MGSKKDRRKTEIAAEHRPAHQGMPQPELMEAAAREMGLPSLTMAPPPENAVHELRAQRLRKLVPQTVQEQLDFLRGELGRTKRRVRDLEARALAHGHPALEAPPQRNGVHIDSQNRYYMHRPDGWHRMGIEAHVAAIDVQPDWPVQRLAEPKGE